MRIAAVVLAVLLPVVAFTEQSLLPPTTDFTPIRLQGDSGAGSVCMVGLNTGLTAAHVAKMGELRWVRRLSMCVVGDCTETGQAMVSKRYDDLDMAFVTLIGLPGQEYVFFFPVAKKAPRLGEHVRILITVNQRRMLTHGYIFDLDDDGDLEVDALAFPGTSGSCVLNDNDEVVGVVKSIRVEVPEENKLVTMRPTAIATPVWGMKIP